MTIATYRLRGFNMGALLLNGKFWRNAGQTNLLKRNSIIWTR